MYHEEHLDDEIQVNPQGKIIEYGINNITNSLPDIWFLGCGKRCVVS
jgi:hypothetical protein